jgi:hypothetical protein
MALSLPVSADEIVRRAYEQRYLIEERVVASLVEIVNQGIRDQVAHGLMDYDFCVPSFIYGFPRFDVGYVGSRLRELYKARGFASSGTGVRIRLSWRTPPQPAPASTPPPPSRSLTVRRRT